MRSPTSNGYSLLLKMGICAPGHRVVLVDFVRLGFMEAGSNQSLIVKLLYGVALTS
jgi:hypothetical protein